MAVMGFVIEAIQKTESLRIGRPLAMSAKPKASSATMRLGPTTIVTAPANSCFSCSSCRAKLNTALLSSRLTGAAALG